VNAEAAFIAEIREGTERLRRADTVSHGFTKLWEHSRLAMSVEALAILQWYASLFDSEAISRARRRLLDYGFVVDAFLTAQSARPPSWWQDEAGP